MFTIADLADDFATYTDNVEPVTLLLRVHAEDSIQPQYAITHAHRNQISSSEHVPAGGDVKQGDILWQFPVAESVSTDTDLLGSTITDEDGEIHTILSASLQVFKTKWEVRTRNLTVASGLNTTVIIAVCNSYKHSSTGEAIEAWTTLYDDIKAKIQPESAEAVVEHSADETKRTYRITLQLDLTIIIGGNYRIQDQNGVIYNVKSYHSSELIDQLPYVIAMRQERAE
jgi:head-tail adaptor